ncbi:MAG: hypothetical protein OXU23_00060, partial [Candidatus Poribacteria bacterium]|nr:hypothetical protein [Candidatus Poribacteria bacterium]
FVVFHKCSYMSERSPNRDAFAVGNPNQEINGMNTFLVFPGYESWRMPYAHSSLGIPRSSLRHLRSSGIGKIAEFRLKQ